MPLLWLSLAFLTGIILASNTSLPLWTWLLLAGAALLSHILAHFTPHWLTRILVWIRRAWSFLPQCFTRITTQFRAYTSRIKLPLPVLILFIACMVGAARYQASLPRITPEHIAWYNDCQSNVIVEGVLVAPPDIRDGYTNLRIRVDSMRTMSDLLFNPVKGLLLARTQPGQDWQYGDRLRLEGTVRTPPEGESFSYRDYLARQGIHSMMNNAQANLLLSGQGNPILTGIYNIKAHTLSLIYQYYPDPEASLLAGILLGVETGIPNHVQEAFRATGTSHIIAISGFNITIIAAVLVSGFSRVLGRRRGAIAAALGIATYTILVGADAAVVRAALFGWLTLLGRQIGRRQTGLNSLAFIAGLMALINPNVLWDIGFQLSFAATLGLMLYATPLTEAFKRFWGRHVSQSSAERLAAPVGEYFLLTLAAQLTTLPITIYHFSQISLISLLANPLILPVQPPVMLLGGVSVLSGLLYQPLGQVVAYAALPLVTFTIRAVEWLSRLPGGVIAFGQATLPVVISLYLILLAVTMYASRLPSPAQKFRPAFAMGALLIFTMLTWRSAFSGPDGKLRITLLDIGTGSAVLVQTPDGRALLISGGSSPSRISDALGRRLPPGQRSLDWLVIAAPERDGVAALPPLLARYPPGEVLWAGPTHGTYDSRTLWEALTTDKIPITPAIPGQALDLGEGALLKILTVSGRGTVLLLEWDRFRLLLPQGIDFSDLDALRRGQTIGSLSALLLPASGYSPLSPPEWIAALQPQVILLSVAADDVEGLPSPETLKAAQGYTLLRTDQNGWIELTSDGRQMWVTVERK